MSSTRAAIRSTAEQSEHRVGRTFYFLVLASLVAAPMRPTLAASPLPELLIGPRMLEVRGPTWRILPYGDSDFVAASYQSISLISANGAIQEIDPFTSEDERTCLERDVAVGNDGTIYFEHCHYLGAFRPTVRALRPDGRIDEVALAPDERAQILSLAVRSDGVVLLLTKNNPVGERSFYSLDAWHDGERVDSVPGFTTFCPPTPTGPSCPFAEVVVDEIGAAYVAIANQIHALNGGDFTRLDLAILPWWRQIFPALQGGIFVPTGFPPSRAVADGTIEALTYAPERIRTCCTIGFFASPEGSLFYETLPHGGALDDSVVRRYHPTGRVTDYPAHSDFARYNRFAVQSNGSILGSFWTQPDVRGDELDLLPPLVDVSSLAPDQLGNVLVAGRASDSVVRVAAGGSYDLAVDLSLDPNAPAILQPADVIATADGGFVVAGFESNNVVAVDASGRRTQLVGPGGNDEGGELIAPSALAADEAGSVYVAGAESHNVLRIDSKGRIVEVANADSGGDEGLVEPSALAVDSEGRIYVAGAMSNNLIRIDRDGAVVELVNATGDGGDASLGDPRSLAIDAEGNVFVAGFGSGNVLRVAPDGAVTHVATVESPSDLIAVGACDLLVSSTAGNAVLRVRSGAEPTVLFEIEAPGELAADADGTIYAASKANHSVYRMELDDSPGLGCQTNVCVGDCDGSDEVTVDEIVAALAVALGSDSVDRCTAADANGDGDITVDEIIAAVGNALAGCG